MKKFQKTILFFLFFTLFLLATNFVFALEINYPKVPGATPPQDFINTASPEQIPSLYIKYILNLTFWASGIIVLGVLLWAGIHYLTSGGKAETMLGARQQISAAFLGILILLSAFIILNILNPQLLILKVAKVEMATTTERTIVPLPAITTDMTRTAIDTELPLGKILDDYLFASSTMRAIKDNATTTLDIANTLKKQNNDLSVTVHQCNCGEAMPTDCGQCPCCGGPCNCDVCTNERGTIENIEKKNLQKIDELKEQQKISIEKLKGVKIELAKLERIERFMKDCPMWRVGSLAQFFYDKDFYIAQKWTLRNVKFWESIVIGEDWVTLYCPVSGTILGETPGIPSESIVKELPPVEAPSAEQQMACTTKIPAGEIIDRAKRIANRLINRLEALIDLDRQMILQVDVMHISVSMCSSQDPRCCTKCVLVGEACACMCVPCGVCNGYGNACPWAQIDEQADKITEIQKKIEVVVNETKEDNIGIVPIIDKIVPNLLDDLDKIVRKPLKECITDIPVENAAETTEPQVMVSDCESAVRAVGPDGVVIQKCCLTEQQFQNCLLKCYLKAGQDYENCLNDCLKATNNEEISICNHSLNFYCCGM